MQRYRVMLVLGFNDFGRNPANSKARRRRNVRDVRDVRDVREGDAFDVVACARPHA